MANIVGQYTDAEFQQMYQQRKNSVVKNTIAKDKCVLKSGNHTYNYYMQHQDGSWTNYDCKTKY